MSTNGSVNGVTAVSDDTPELLKHEEIDRLMAALRQRGVPGAILGELTLIPRCQPANFPDGNQWFSYVEITVGRTTVQFTARASITNPDYTLVLADRLATKLKQDPLPTMTYEYYLGHVVAGRVRRAVRDTLRNRVVNNAITQVALK